MTTLAFSPMVNMTYGNKNLEGMPSINILHKLSREFSFISHYLNLYGNLSNISVDKSIYYREKISEMLLKQNKSTTK